MANNLSAAQQEYFSRRDIDLAGFPPELVLIKGATTHDITKRADTFGELVEEIGNVVPSAGQPIIYPVLSVTVHNDDGLFSSGHANSLWGGPPQDWTLRFVRYDRVTLTGGSVYYIELDVARVRLDGAKAIIIATHKLAKYWGREFTRDDRHEMDWNGVSHGVHVG